MERECSEKTCESVAVGRAGTLASRCSAPPSRRKGETTSAVDAPPGAPPGALPDALPDALRERAVPDPAPPLGVAV